MMMMRGVFMLLSALALVTATPAPTAAPTTSPTTPPATTTATAFSEFEYLSLHAQAPVREGRLGCGVTLTFLMPTDPVINVTTAPIYDITFSKEGSTTVLATCAPPLDPAEDTTTDSAKYLAFFDEVTGWDYDHVSENTAVGREQYHHLNVFVHYARFTIYDLKETDAGVYTIEVSFNGVVGTASTELIIINADCPANDRGGSIVNFGFGEILPPSSAPHNDPTKSMFMMGPWFPPSPGRTSVSAREGEPATTDERWVVENIQIYVDAKVGSCLYSPQAEENVCKEGMEVRVYDMNPEVDQDGNVLGDTAVATLDQRAYIVPYGVDSSNIDDMHTFPIVTPFRKEPLTMKKGQFLALLTKQHHKSITASDGTITKFETSLIVEWEQETLGFGYCSDRYTDSYDECGNDDEGKRKWKNFEKNPQYWYSDAPRVSGFPGAQNEAIHEYVDYDENGAFGDGDFEDLTKVTMKVARPTVDPTKTLNLNYGFKAKMVFLETWYPRQVEEAVVVPTREVGELNTFLLYLLLILVGVLICCCCICCMLYGRKAKHLRERRMFMSSMLGQSFNISSETGEPLPPNWYEEKSADGNIYYYNPTTQESMWDIPTFG